MQTHFPQCQSFLLFFSLLLLLSLSFSYYLSICSYTENKLLFQSIMQSNVDDVGIATDIKAIRKQQQILPK